MLLEDLNEGGHHGKRSIVKKILKINVPGSSKNGFDGFDESQQKFQVHLTFMVDIKRHFGLWMVKGILTFLTISALSFSTISTLSFLTISAPHS